jgi:hypothetical protein
MHKEVEPVRQIEDMYDDLGDTMTFTGFDDALIGFSQRMNEPTLAVYDYLKMIDILMDRDHMDYEEADEFLQFNTVGAWFGERTPIIVFPVEYYAI